MSPMLRHAVLAFPLLVAASLHAEEAPKPDLPPSLQPFVEELQRAEGFARQGAESLFNAMDQLLRAVPQYEPPTVDENGDIIIRRKPPGEIELGRPRGRNRTIQS
jgi:hypothetical protein